MKLEDRLSKLSNHEESKEGVERIYSEKHAPVLTSFVSQGTSSFYHTEVHQFTSYGLFYDSVLSQN